MFLFDILFDSEDDTPVHHSRSGKASKHNEVLLEEITNMLRSGIITLASSALFFPVVMTTKSDEKPRFCGDNRILNRRMKANRFPLLKIQEIFEELANGLIITTFDLF